MDLTYAQVDFGNLKLLDHTKIKKEDAFDIIKQNSLEIISEGNKSHTDEFTLPSNFNIIKNLLNIDNVYAAPYPSFNHFDGNEFLGEHSVRTFKSNELSGIVKDVSKYSSKGFKIYIYSYYIMTVDKCIDDELTIQEPFFWYRMGLKQ